MANIMNYRVVHNEQNQYDLYVLGDFGEEVKQTFDTIDKVVNEIRINLLIETKLKK